MLYYTRKISDIGEIFILNQTIHLNIGERNVYDIKENRHYGGYLVLVNSVNHKIKT